MIKGRGWDDSRKRSSLIQGRGWDDSRERFKEEVSLIQGKRLG